MLHNHELSRAVQADRDRDMRRHVPLAVGQPSGHRHPEVPDSGIVVPGRHRFVLRREPRVAFGG